MIRGAYGIGHITLLDFIYLCESLSLNFGYVENNRAKKYQVTNGQDVVPYPIYFNSLSSFLRLRTRIKRSHCAFICDNPILISECGISLLGENLIDKKLFRYESFGVKGSDLIASLRSAKTWEPNYTPYRVIESALQIAATMSILAPIQTALYKIKGTDNRNWIQTCLFDWLAGSMTKSNFIDNLSILSEFERVLVVTSIRNEKLLDLRAAAKAIIREGMSYEVAKKVHSVPEYDLKYICGRNSKANQ